MKRPLEIGKIAQGLYILDEEIAKGLDHGEIYNCSSIFVSAGSSRMEDLKTQFSFNCSQSYKDINLWHHRMGHISPKKMTYMSVQRGLDLNKNSCIFHCDICPRAKQHRLPFHSSSTHL